MIWQLQTAKNKLSVVVNAALRDGPQTITRHGKPTAVVLSFDEYQKKFERKTLAQLLQECPEKDWIPERVPEDVRTIDLE
jgi:prevent-host-death family protein